MYVEQVLIRNFGSFKDTKFDLKGQGIVLINGWSSDNDTSNGSGKSTLFEALCWGLFGQSPKGLRGDDVVNRLVGKDCSVEVALEDNGIKYKIIRTRKHSKYKNSTILSINGSIVGGVDSKDMQREIDKCLGIDYDTFTNSVFFPQNSRFKFVQATDSEKKDILTNVLNLDWIDSLKKIVKDRVTAASVLHDQSLTTINDLKALILESDAEIDEFNSKLNSVKAEKKGKIETLKKEISECDVSVDTKELTAEIGSLREDLMVLDTNKSKIEQLTLKRDDLSKARLTKIKELNGKSTAMVDAVESKIAELRQTKSTIESALVGLITKLNADKSQLSKDLAVLEHKIDSHRDDYNSKKDLIDKGMCPTCSQDVCDSTFQDDIDAIKQDVRSMLTGAKDLKGQIDKLDLTIADNDLDKSEDLKDIEKKIDETKKKGKLALEKYRQKIDSLDSPTEEESEISREILSLKSTLEAEPKLHAKLNALMVSRDTIKERAKHKDGLMKQLSELENDNSMVDFLKTKISDIKSKKKKNQKKLAEVTASQQTSLDDQRYLTILDKMFSNQGLKSFILDNAIYELNRSSERYLDQMFDGALAVKFTTLSATKSGSIRQKIGTSVSMNNVPINISQLSGGEVKRVSLAVDLALSDLIANRSHRKFDLLVFDEATENLDERGQEAFFDLLRSLSNEKDSIFLISHNSDLKNKFDKVIDIVKENGISRMMNG